MQLDSKELFVLFNSKRKKILCSWWEDMGYFFDQKINYIGVTNGLGGYNKVLQDGWFDRRDFKQSLLLTVGYISKKTVYMFILKYPNNKISLDFERQIKINPSSEYFFMLKN